MPYPCKVRTANLNSIGLQTRYGVSSLVMEPGNALSRRVTDFEDIFEDIPVVVRDTVAFDWVEKAYHDAEDWDWNQAAGA